MRIMNWKSIYFVGDIKWLSYNNRFVVVKNASNFIVENFVQYYEN